MPFWKLRSPYTFPHLFWEAMRHGPGAGQGPIELTLIHGESAGACRLAQKRWQLFRMCLRAWGQMEAELDAKWLRRTSLRPGASGGWDLVLQISDREAYLQPFVDALSSRNAG
jgi:hypothetical protein